ncbi:MAG: hypothetical protein ABIQ18_32655 [Umezawaea sp.]
MTYDLEPLGIYAPLFNGDSRLTRESLTPLVGGLDQDLRPRVAAYLRAGTILFAIMEYTTDVLGDRFGVSGGSAVLSDGTYFWRLDAADYVEVYGTAVPDAAVAHMRALDWRPPVFEGTAYYELDDRLLARFAQDRSTAP